MRMSVWTTVPKVTLPVNSSRRACSVMLTVPHVMDRVRMTAMCVATLKLSDTTESVWPDVQTTPTMMRRLMNAEVREVEEYD